MQDNPAAAVIVAIIGFAVCLVCAISMFASGLTGWAYIMIGACVAYACIIAVEWNEYQDIKRKNQAARSRIK